MSSKATTLLPPDMSFQSKSILRPPSSSTKRRADTLDLDGTEEQPSTPKRRKVLFSDNSPTVHELGGRSLASVRTEVRKTLDQHRRGDDEEYLLLKRHFDTSRRSDADDYDDDEPPIKPQELMQYVLALASCAPMLKEKPFRDLANAVLNCVWVGRDERFVQAYIELLAALASVGSYLYETLAMIFELFSETRRWSWSVPGYSGVSKLVVEQRLHAALRRLLRISPAAVRSVVTMAKAKYPVLDDDKRTHATYVNNLLRIREYAPDLGRSLINLVVEQLVSIDVNMQTDLDDLDDELTAAVHRALAESRARALGNLDDDEASDEESDDDDDEDDANAGLQRIKNVKNNIEVLDAVMDILYRFYAPYFHDPHSETAVAECKAMISQFTDIILPMRKSRHTQFLLFHFVQKSDQLTSLFIEACERIAFKGAPSVLGDYAVAYLASFLARGAHIPAYIIQDVFKRLLQCLERRRAAYEKSCQGPNITKYYSYYALCQATFYIFCFRWKDLVVSVPEHVEPEDPLSYVGLDLDWGENTRRILKNNAHGKLNPLKVCSPGIVEEFAKLAHKLNLVYVYPVLEINKRVRLAQFVRVSYSSGGSLRDIGSDSRDDGSLQLDSYFPFDPYQLPGSKKWVEVDYLPWNPILGLNADEDDYDSDDSEVEEELVAELLEETATDSEEDEDEE
ncbi:related to RNA Polymerase I Transcription Factor Rrn3 [Cephalotrichum gorgonifer]|uniref:Related to RNA Polymerase I Transcription Factor Rrn3 n=1 Tax=Cephalotrichum gorgonifer TaxID=2041049 RepID=A0AAE8SRA3_9PEZI|nr:related to RNA Polymerase I Transcription Factor Rrn3 [Cephalotrichum gorgonifer]